MNYHNYEKINLGYSDISALVAVGPDFEKKLKSQIVEMGADSSYSAYLVDKKAEIGNHYNLVAVFKNWLKIYDDDNLVFDSFELDKIFKIYRAGDLGIIIQVL